VRDRADNEKKGEEPCVHEEHHKVFSVVEADTVVQPRAVVVHVEYALVTSRAMVASC
jgi:hypothetical protein